MLLSFFLRPLPKLLAFEAVEKGEEKKKYLCLYKYIYVKI